MLLIPIILTIAAGYKAFTLSVNRVYIVTSFFDEFELEDATFDSFN